MFYQAVLATALTLPILSACTHDLTSNSDVTYFDQLPSDAYDDDLLLGEYKSRIFVRKDISYLDPENGPSLKCLPNGQVKLHFASQTAFNLDELSREQLLSHPVIIPHGYDDSGCPELKDHTIFGPRESVPEDTLKDLEADGFAVMLAVSEDEVQENEITLSVDWITYHGLIGVTGSAPKDLAWLGKGVLPYSDNDSSSKHSTRGRKRKFGGIFRSVGKLFASGVVQGATSWSLDQIAKVIIG